MSRHQRKLLTPVQVLIYGLPLSLVGALVTGLAMWQMGMSFPDLFPVLLFLFPSVVLFVAIPVSLAAHPSRMPQDVKAARRRWRAVDTMGRLIGLVGFVAFIIGSLLGQGLLMGLSFVPMGIMACARNCARERLNRYANGDVS